MSALGVLRRAMVGRGDGAGREATGAEGTREAASASRRRREGLNERGPGRFARERAAPERGRVHLLEPKRDGERHSYADRPSALDARVNRLWRTASTAASSHPPPMPRTTSTSLTVPSLFTTKRTKTRPSIP